MFLDEAAQAGQRTVEHIDSLLFVQDGDNPRIGLGAAVGWYKTDTGQAVLQTLAENGTWFTPTLAVYEVGLPSQGMDPKQVMPVLIAMTRLLKDKNIPLLAGTDTARRTFGDGPGLEPGKGLHRELQLLVEVGLTPLEAIQCATLQAARALHLERDFGTIEPGKIADFLILPEDPLGNIAATESVETVVTRGRILRGDWLTRFRGL
jgi:imidazolonepropionase-like amidohydrolase